MSKFKEDWLNVFDKDNQQERMEEFNKELDDLRSKLSSRVATGVKAQFNLSSPLKTKKPSIASELDESPISAKKNDLAKTLSKFSEKRISVPDNSEDIKPLLKKITMKKMES